MPARLSGGHLTSDHGMEGGRVAHELILGPRTGKSTITHTICEQLREKDVLASSFFCKRGVPEQRDPRRVLPSLAHTLAILNGPYRELLLRAVEKEPDISSSPLNLQLGTLFTTPFMTLREQVYSGQPLLVAMDALDECGGDPATRA